MKYALDTVTANVEQRTPLRQEAESSEHYCFAAQTVEERLRQLHVVPTALSSFAAGAILCFGSVGTMGKDLGTSLRDMFWNISPRVLAPLPARRGSVVRNLYPEMP